MVITCLFISCSDKKDGLEKNVEVIDQETTLECSYDKSNDITVEFWGMANEVIEKDLDYNQAKFDDNLVNWEGKSIYLKDVPISSISKTDEYGTPPNINLRLGEKKIGVAKTTFFEVIIFFEKDSEIVDYDVNDMVDVKGVIDIGLISLDRYYSVYLKCGEIIKK